MKSQLVDTSQGVHSASFTWTDADYWVFNDIRSTPPPCPLYPAYTVKKMSDFLVPNRDVTNQTLPD
jgi:hypothetical protein